MLAKRQEGDIVAGHQEVSVRRWSRGWIILALVYAAFFYWYTSFEGPLTPEEIVHFTEVVNGAPGMEDEQARIWIEFMENDTGDDWAMWNAVDLAERPKLIEGIEPGATSEEVVNRYAEPFFAQAVLRASHPVLSGAAAAPAIDVWGVEGARDWDRGILVRYRSRRDIMEIIEAMVTSQDSIHAFKVAAVEKTIAFPLDPWFQLGDPRILLALIFVIFGLVMQLRYTARSRPPMETASTGRDA